jgi:SAM-dependent methyltransferase
MTDTIDTARIEQFGQQLFGTYVGALTTYMIDIGHRLGLFDELAKSSGTSDEIAARASLDERYVREWLAALVTAGAIAYDPAHRTYELPAEHAVLLTGPGSNNVARFAQLPTLLAKHVQPVSDAFRTGGGVPYSAYRPEFTSVMDAANRNFFDEQLVDAVVPLVPGLAEVLTAGARAADIGCGTGHALVLLAAAYPNSTFVGYDLAEDALAAGRAEAKSAGVGNVRFEQRDVARLDIDRKLDVVLSFDTIHDQVDPRAVLAGIHRALVPGGRYVMVEPRVSSNLEDNIGNPMAPLVYGTSVLHCMTVSLAGGGAGLGTGFGEQLARELLVEAGFESVTVEAAPGDPLDGVFICSRPR